MSEAALKKIGDKVIELKYNADEFIFWSEHFTNKGKDYKFIAPKLRDFLHKEGFGNYQTGPIRIVNNIGSIVEKEFIFKYVLEYIESFNDEALEAAFLKQGESLLLRNKGILIGLPEIQLSPLRDTPNKSYKTYKNGVVVVEKEKPFKLLSYDKIDGFVWEGSILQRDFNILKDSDFDSGMFAQFIKNITKNDEHFNSTVSAIGYILHSYKDPRTPICVIINDENLIDKGKPEGGTGKGLFVKGISQIIVVAPYNGKNSSFSNEKFAYQSVDEKTRAIFIDDAPRNFDFEALFSVITDDLPIEKKHQPVKVIPFQDSPKFLITTNYTIKGDSSSYKRRRFDTFLTNHYSAEKSPSDDFGVEFFHGWDEKEWQLFDWFMLGCLRYYLSCGLIYFDTPDIKLKMLKNETSSDFVELMDEQFINTPNFIEYSEVREKLILFYGSKYDFHIKHKKTIVEWVERYVEHMGYELIKKRATYGCQFRIQK